MWITRLLHSATKVVVTANKYWCKKRKKQKSCHHDMTIQKLIENTATKWSASRLSGLWLKWLKNVTVNHSETEVHPNGVHTCWVKKTHWCSVSRSLDAQKLQQWILRSHIIRVLSCSSLKCHQRGASDSALFLNLWAQRHKLLSQHGLVNKSLVLVTFWPAPRIGTK